MLSIIILASYFVLVLIFSYFWSVVIYKLAISKKIHFIILAIGLYALWGYYTFWDKKIFILSMSGFFLTALYVAAFMFFRKDFSKKLVIFSSFVCGFCLWQLEIPQSMFVRAIGIKIHINDNDYVVLEDKNRLGREDNVLLEDVETNYIFEKENIYICNSIDCKSDKKIIGNVSTPTLPRSFFLGCINFVGYCFGSITPGSTHEYVLKYLKENQIKQGENNDKK